MAPLAASSLCLLGLTLTDARIIGNSKANHVVDGSHVGFKATIGHVDVTETASPAQVVKAKVDQTGPQKMMGMIDMFRAEKCAQMKDDHGKEFGSSDACKEFMYNKCKAGGDKAMDAKEVTSEQDFCSKFLEKEREEMKETDKEKHEGILAKEAEGAAAAKAEKEAAAKVKAAVEAFAEAGSATKGGGKSSGNGTNGTNGSKNERYWGTDVEKAVTRESSWDNTDKAGRNDGGKYPKAYLMGRLHMNESTDVPAQGFRGENVSHDDGQSLTSDWLSENDFKDGDDKHIAHAGRHDHKWPYQHAKLEPEEPKLVPRAAASMLSFGAISMSVPLLMILA